jgi:hypothetical protein
MLNKLSTSPAVYHLDAKCDPGWWNSSPDGAQWCQMHTTDTQVLSPGSRLQIHFPLPAKSSCSPRDVTGMKGAGQSQATPADLRSGANKKQSFESSGNKREHRFISCLLIHVGGMLWH